MTTTLRARFDGKVLIPVGEVDLPIGQEVELQVAPSSSHPPGSPAAVLEALRSLPPVPREDVEELERLIEESKLPVNDRGIFDED
jgi:hypothetical protein